VRSRPRPRLFPTSRKVTDRRSARRRRAPAPQAQAEHFAAQRGRGVLALGVASRGAEDGEHGGWSVASGHRSGGECLLNSIPLALVSDRAISTPPTITPGAFSLHFGEPDLAPPLESPSLPPLQFHVPC
jgi:hypothetical protein